MGSKRFGKGLYGLIKGLVKARNRFSKVLTGLSKAFEGSNKALKCLHKTIEGFRKALKVRILSGLSNALKSLIRAL